MSNSVPDGWDIKSISNISRVGSSKRILQSEYVAEGVPFYRSKEAILRSKGRDLTSPLYISRLRYEELKAKFGAPVKDEILVTAVGTIGVVYLIEDTEFYFKDGNLLWIRQIEDCVNPKFLAKYLASDIFQQSIARITSGSSQAALTIEKLGELEFNLPPLPEQQKIAAILASVDEVIEKTQAQIDKLKDLKTGMMQQLLTSGVGIDGKPHTEFKDSAVGRIPKVWEVKLLTEVADNLDSRRIPIKSADRASLRNQYRYYGASGVIDYVDDFIFDGEYILLGEDGENVISRNSPLAFIVEGKFWVNNHAHVLVSKSEMDMKYLCEYLESIDYSNIASGSAQPKITKGALNVLKIPVPTYQEQMKIGSILQKIDIKALAVRKKMKLLESTKKALMQDLLTGKVRVTVPESTTGH